MHIENRDKILIGRVLVVLASIPIFNLYLFFISIPFFIIGSILLFYNLSSFKEKLIWFLVPIFINFIIIAFFSRMNSSKEEASSFYIIGLFLFFIMILFYKKDIFWFILPIFFIVLISAILSSLNSTSYDNERKVLPKNKLHMVLSSGFHGNVAIVQSQFGINIDSIKGERKIKIPDDGILLIINHVHSLYNYDVIYEREPSYVYIPRKYIHNMKCRNLNVQNEKYTNMLISFYIENFEMPYTDDSLQNFDLKIVKKIKSIEN